MAKHKDSGMNRIGMIDTTSGYHSTVAPGGSVTVDAGNVPCRPLVANMRTRREE